jgi:5'-nucleotidase
MSDEKMRVLLVGDDRPFSTGVMGLYDFLKSKYEVRVLMPQYDASGKGHAVTIDREIPIKKISDDVYVVDGTAVDCVRIGLLHPIFKNYKVDLVVAGVNQGPNLGWDVYVSGTVSAAREACMRGVPSFAISKASFDVVTIQDLLVVYNYFDEFLKISSERACSCLNINIPTNGVVKGCLNTILGGRYLTRLKVSGDDTHARYDVEVENVNEVSNWPFKSVFDYRAVSHGFISVTHLIN